METQQETNWPDMGDCVPTSTRRRDLDRTVGTASGAEPQVQQSLWGGEKTVGSTRSRPLQNLLLRDRNISKVSEE